MYKESSGLDQDFSEYTFQTPDSESRHFEQRFNSKDYLKNYYPPLNSAVSNQILQKIKELPANIPLDAGTVAEELGVPIEAVENVSIINFQTEVTKELLRAYPEDHINVLDVGGGPSVYQHMALSFVTDNIVHAEFLEQNRNEAKKWILDEPDAYDWNSYLEFVKTTCKNDPEFIQLWEHALETQAGDTENLYPRLMAQSRGKILDGSTEEFKTYVRQRLIGHEIPVDAFQADLDTSPYGYDFIQAITRESLAEVVSSNFMIESATGDRQKWQAGLENITSRIKPDGYLAMTAIRNADWYAVGDERMPAVKVSADDLEKTLTSMDFEIVKMQEIEGSDKETTGYDGMIFVFARRKQAAH